MGDKTNIQWTDSTNTPIRARNTKTGKVGWHCEKPSAGCKNCYAEAWNKRFGTGLPFQAKHLQRGDVELFLDDKMLTQPLRWKRPRRIFPCSMTDIFGEFVPDAMIDKMFAVMALTPHHIYQPLTKRSARMREYVAAGRRQDAVALEACDLIGSVEHLPIEAIDETNKWPLPNVHLGVSAEDQDRADERIPDLLATPAAKRVVSYEPAIGPIDFTPWLAIDWQCSVCREYFSGRHQPACPSCGQVGGWCGSHAFNGRHYPDGPISPSQRGSGLDQIIVGGESGPGARPCNVAWIRSTIAQCQAAGIPVFVKQLGKYPVQSMAYGDVPVPLDNSKGGDMAEWPADLQIREMPR